MGHLFGAPQWSVIETEVRQSSSHIQVSSDASGSVGCEAIWSPYWLQFKWPETSFSKLSSPEEESITFQELLPIVFAYAVWGSRWQKCVIRVYCDNTGAVAVVNSGYSKVPGTMHLLRCLFVIRARFELQLEAVHIPGDHNHLADAISRDKLSVLFSQVPAARELRSTLPSSLVSLLMDNQIDWTSPTWSQRFGSCYLPV